MDELVGRLLDELGSGEEAVRLAALGRALSLPLEGLRLLIEGYQQRRSQRWAPAQTTGRNLLQRIRLFVDTLALPQADPPELARLSHSLADVIAFSDDPAAVGPILALLAGRLTSGADWELRNECCGALERLLPRLRLEDTEGWTDEQRQVLVMPLERIYLYYRLLAETEGRIAWMLFLPEPRTRRRVPFYTLPPRMQAIHVQAVAVLKALEQIGDERELVLVRELAELKPPTSIAQEMQRAASVCLPCIERRAHERRQARMLLRPTDMGSDVLLRPAAGGQEAAQAEELLRPKSDLRIEN